MKGNILSANDRRVKYILELNGEYLTRAEFAARIGIPYVTLAGRMLAGWPPEKLSTPSRVKLPTKELTEERKKARRKMWYKKNREKFIRESIEKRRTNPQSNIKHRLSSCLSQALKHQGAKKHAPIMLLVGCSKEHLKIHIEKQFTSGMSWENRREWHIDHIRPCASFDLTDPVQQAACFHFTNLRPLWKWENLSKHAKITSLV